MMPEQALPAALYQFKVMHVRLRPVTHRFTYRIFSVLLDIDRLREADVLSPVFSVDRFNLLSFHAADHGPRDGGPLRPHVERLLQRAGLGASPFRITLLCMPRVLGFAFNPITIYYCFDDENRIIATIFEVRNTFGEHHSYVVRVDEPAAPGAPVRQECDKLFYVSPFFDMGLHYKFRFDAPGDALHFRMLVEAPDGPVFAATMAGKSQPFTTPTLLAAALKTPFLAAKVVGGIHFEALRLWLKGLRLRPRPAPPAPASFGETGAFSNNQPAEPAAHRTIP